MGLRIRKSIKICKGVRVNLGKKGASLTVGKRGLSHTVHASGRTTTSVGLPGTGVSYVAINSSGGKGRNTQTFTGTGTEGSFQSDIEFAVEQYNIYVDYIRSLHKDCSEGSDWNEILKEERPFNPLTKGPRENEARNKMSSYTPSFFERVFKGKREKKLKELEELVHEGMRKDQEEYYNWYNQHKFAEGILNGSLETFKQFIEETPRLKEIPNFFHEISVVRVDSEKIEISCLSKIEEIVPDFQYGITKTGRFSEKKLTKTSYFDIIKDYICGGTIRTAREIFAALPINGVIINVIEEKMNSATGFQEKRNVLSVEFTREVMDGINFTNIDPMECIGVFNNNFKFLKTKGFKAL